MNYGGSDYSRVWGPWCERFLWFPTQIPITRPTVVGERAVYKWMWLRTVYYRELTVETVYPVGGAPSVVAVDYAMNIFDILRKKD